MGTTLIVCRVLGPVLLLRALSILIDRKHFEDMIRNVEREVRLHCRSRCFLSHCSWRASLSPSCIPTQQR